MLFSALGLCDELLKTVEEQGYTSPSPVQSAAIPVILAERDLIAVAQTGTGKTASFTLPLLQLLNSGSQAALCKKPSKKPSKDPGNIRALIITPTRELAAQVAKNVQTYGQSTNLSSLAVFGGVRIEAQIHELQNGIDILIATPGRLLDLHSQKAVNFAQLDILVLDEADRMLDLGFIDDINKIESLLPRQRQTLMFSATFSKEIKSLAKSMLSNPVLLELTPSNSHVNSIQQILHPVDKARKSELLVHLIKQNDFAQMLVFTRTKRGADELRNLLESKNISAESIHANRTQRARTQALDGFREGTIKVLVATDIASRGIDVSDLPCVINFDLPFVPEDYVHRIGRTGRASAQGIAITFYSEDEAKQLNSIERLLKRKFTHELVQGFAPTPQAKVPAVEDDLYGNFEPDPNASRRSKPKHRSNPKHRSKKSTIVKPK